MTTPTLSRTTPTEQSRLLADLETQIAATRAELGTAWGDEAKAHLASLERDRAEMLALVAGAALEA